VQAVKLLDHVRRRRVQATLKKGRSGLTKLATREEAHRASNSGS